MLPPFITQSPKSHRKWVVLRVPTQVWWWENLQSFHYSTASIDEKNPSRHWTSCLNQKEFPSQNCKVGFLMHQGRHFSFSVAPRRDPDLKEQLTKLSRAVGLTLRLPSITPCVPWDSFLTYSISARQGKPRDRKPIKICAGVKKNLSIKSQRVNTFRLWEPCNLYHNYSALPL